MKRWEDVDDRQVAGKVVKRIVRQSPEAISIEFSDGSSLYVDHEADRIQMSLSPIELQKPPDEEFLEAREENAY